MVRLLTAAALAAAIASPVAAQQIGTYSGTSADGSGVTFVVGTDPANSSLAVTSATVFFNATCSGGAPNLDTGWGYGLTQDIVARKVSNTTASNYFTIAFSLTFSRDGQTATGRISSDGASLFPVGPTPTKGVICKSRSQTLSVAFQPGAAKVNPPATSATMLGKFQSVHP